MGDEDQTPVRKVSTAALDLGAIASEDLLEHLRRAGHSIGEAPAGFIARVASWMARAGRRVAQVEREETDRIRAELELVTRQRDIAVEELHKVRRERDKLASLMREG